MAHQSSPVTVPDTSFAVIGSDRIRMRRFVPADAARFAEYRSHPGVARYQGWDTPFSLGQARQSIASMTGAQPDFPGEWFRFALEEASTRALIGDVAMFTHRKDPRVATVGVTLAAEAQGHGFATEGMTLLLDYLLIKRRKHRVIAECDPRNEGVVSLLERLGMRREAHHVSSYWTGDGWSDEYVYAIIAGEWAA